MAVKLVADLHGRYSDLCHEMEEGDVLLVLGDILDLIDWADLTGIIPEVVGRENLVEKFLAAMRRGPEEVMELREEILSPHGKYYHEIRERAAAQYHDFAAALRSAGCRAYVIYGNGDLPDLLREALREAENAALAAGSMEIAGVIFGFVPGAVLSPFRMPAEMEDSEFGQRLAELGAVEVLCTHIPPRVEEALFDVVAGRPVEGSASLLRYLKENSPGFLYHGHVHQPAQRELRVGGTRVINVAYYKREGYVHLHR